MPDDYLTRILDARVYDVAIESPLERAPSLSARLRNEVWLKREDLQPVFSFKLRGAYNKMVRLPPAALERGVISASAGNHAQGVAYAAQRLGTRAGPLARLMLRGRRTKHWMRTIYALRSLWSLKRGLLRDAPGRDYWQAGKSVAGVDGIEPAGEIVRRFREAWCRSVES